VSILKFDEEVLFLLVAAKLQPTKKGYPQFSDRFYVRPVEHTDAAPFTGRGAINAFRRFGIMRQRDEEGNPLSGGLAGLYYS